MTYVEVPEGGRVYVELHSTAYAEFKSLGLSGERFQEYTKVSEGARYVRELRKRLTPIDKVASILVRLRRAGFDVEITKELRKVLQERTLQEWLDKEALKERIAHIDADLFARTGYRLYPYQRTGSHWLARMFSALLADDPGLGKSQPDDEPVLTPHGWRLIGELKVGDEVIGSDGRPTRVLDVFPQGTRSIFRVRLTDGSSTRCDLEHLWFVKCSIDPKRRHPGRVMTLSEIIDAGLRSITGQSCWFVPILEHVDHDNRARTKYVPIESVEPCGEAPSRCIRVEAEDRLYVTRDYILTHNTLEVLVALPANVPVLVVCPAVAKGDWRGELRKWRPGVSTDTLYGRSSFRWPRPGEVLITNYEILPDIHDRDGLTDAKGNVIRRACDGKLPAEPCKGCKERITWLGPPGQAGSQMITVRDSHKEDCEERGRMKEPFDCMGCHPFLATAPSDLVVVFDEIQKIKHWKSQRTRRSYAIAESGRKRNGRSWGASGTPIENEPSELWTIARVIGAAEASFGSHDDFVALFKGKRKHFGGYEWGVPGDEVVERLQRFMLRRIKHEVLPQLPRKTWGWHEVKLDVRALREIELLIKQSGRTVDQVAALLQEQEIGFEMMSAVRAALAFAKIPAMMEIVEDFEERNEPLIVFSAHRAPIDVLASRPGWVIITGDLDAKKKTAAADSFQNGFVARDGEPYETEERDGVSIRRRIDRVTRQRIYPIGIAITIPAGSVSLTLTRACNELFVDRSWKPTENAQAEDRAVRIGQTRGTHVKTLVANHPLDERLAEIIDRKLRLIQSSVDAAADGSDAPLTEEDLESEFREVQVAIAGDRAIRRGPESAEERDALERLHTYRFERRSDERLAGELAEEAGSIGLSSPQWCLAVRLAARGIDPDTVVEEPMDDRVLAPRRKETSSELPDGPEGL